MCVFQRWQYAAPPKLEAKAKVDPPPPPPPKQNPGSPEFTTLLESAPDFSASTPKTISLAVSYTHLTLPTTPYV